MNVRASYGALSNGEDTDPELAWMIHHGLEKPAKRNDATMKLCIVGGKVGVTLSYTAERVMFKVLMDRLAPFRLFVVQIITLLYTLVLAIPFVVMSVRYWDDSSLVVRFQISKTKTLLIGFLEAVQLLLMAIPTPFVPPTHTILLLQFSLPITGAITNANKSSWHNVGVYLVMFGSACAILPLICIPEASQQNESRIPVIYSSFMYLASGVPAALSQAYKKKCIIAQNEHVCLHSLNFWVSLFQFLFLALFVPMVYMIKQCSQGLHFYPLDGLEHNVHDGWKCCIALYNAGNVYREDLKCDFALLLEIAYVVSVLLLGFFLQLIMTKGEKYHRVAVVAGLSISFAAMALYAELLPEMPRRSLNLFTVTGAISIAGGVFVLL